MRNVVFKLLGINIVVFILQIVLGTGFTELFLLDSSRLLFEPWRLVTSMFLHGDLNHLFFNMYGLFLFGSFLEPKIGSKRFLWVYLCSGLLAGLLGSFVYARALGASGALMGIIGLMIIVMPQLRLLFFFVIPMPLWVAGVIWVAIDTVGIFIPNGVANIAHLVGMAAGLGYGLYMKKKGMLHTPTTHVRAESSYSHSSKIELNDEDINEYLRTGRL